MKYRELLEPARKEIRSEREEAARLELKERLREMEAAQRVFDAMKERFNELLDKDVDDAVFCE